MPKGKFLTDFEKGQIRAYAEERISKREIARRLRRSHNVILNFLKDPDNYGNNHAGGLTPTVTAKEKRLFLRDLTNKSLSIREAKRANRLTASVTTLWRSIHVTPNIKFQRMKVMPALKPHHMSARLEWARDHMSWTSEWHKVIFSDEKKFNLDGPDGYKYYWHDLRREQQWVSKSVAGGGSVMVWGAIGYNERSNLVIIDGNLNAKKYIDILQQNLLIFATRNAVEDYIFQQDNCPAHKSQAVSQWITDNNINKMQWPAYSPDINIIENCWGHLVRMVYGTGRQFHSRQELKQCINEKWQEMPQEYIQHLFKSMPDRIFQLIHKNGHKTDY